MTSAPIENILSKMPFVDATLRKLYILAAVLALSLEPHNHSVDAKISSGKAHLSGAYTEATLG